MPPVRIPLTKGFEAIVDPDDYEVVSTYSWQALVDPNKRTVYAVTAIREPNGRQKRVLMHRMILGASHSEQIDHRDGDGLNNRRQNLRKATGNQNAYNRRRRVTASNPFRGVERLPSGRWRATITAEGRRQHLGTFPTAEEAAEAYNRSARTLHGDFASLNEVRHAG